MAATAALTSNAVSISRAEDGDDKDTGEEVEDFVEIDRLEQLGINRGDIKKAKDSGFATCESLMMNCKKVYVMQTCTDDFAHGLASERAGYDGHRKLTAIIAPGAVKKNQGYAASQSDLVAIKGLSEAKIDKMMEAARQLCKTASWMTASVYSAWRDSTIMKISTGASALDQVLGGGFETKSITELYGEHRTGKTQICHTLCVTSQMPQECGGGAGKVAYLDAEGTFRPERIRPIAERFGLDPDAVLENILCARSFTFEHLFDLLVAVAAKMAEEGTYKVLIVDSIIAHLRVDFSGRGELAERQQVLGKLLNRLKKISEEFNVAVIITNHVMADPSGGAVFVVDAKKPIGGHVLAHAATFRISLRKGKAEQRIAKVVDAPNLAEAEAVFQVAVNGISNFQD